MTKSPFKEDFKKTSKECGHKRGFKWNISEIKSVAFHLGHTVVDDVYRNDAVKLEIICPIGHHFLMSWNSFSQGKGCHTCTKGVRWSLESVREKALERGYTLLSKSYKNTLIKLKMVCPSGHFYSSTWGNFMTGHGCRICSNKKMGLSRKIDFSVVLEDIEKSGYKYVSGEYINLKTRINLECDKGHVYNVIASSFRKGHRCPLCNRSLGEVAISEYLDSKNVPYVREKRFPECKDKRPLPFDFYLETAGSNGVLIEFNGLQHYKSKEYFGGDKSLKIQKRHDKIKSKFCKKNGISLVVIHYRDLKKIPKILAELIEEVE